MSPMLLSGLFALKPDNVINGKFNSNSNPYAIRLSLSNIKNKIFKLLKKKNFNFKKCTY